MKFEILVNKIQETHDTFQESTASSINRHLTIRNWLIGFYIFEFEHKGEDRAIYGEKLLAELAKVIAIKGLSTTNLKISRQFYLLYPQISQVIGDQLASLGFKLPSIGQSLTDQFQKTDNQSIGVSKLIVPPDKIISKLSYTHLVQLFPINDPIKRAFYEMECIKGNWSVRELKRQINTLYYERSGMSRRPDQLSLLAQEKGEQANEHIGQLKTYINYYKKEIMLESDNPPIGILLVTKNKKALVEYAVADTDLQLFVSRYMIELPSKERLEEFIRKELSTL